MNKQIPVFLGCVINNGKILMIQRNEEECPEAHLKWELPGGKAGFDETPEQAVTREVLEETGNQIKVIKLLPHIYTSYWDYDWGKLQVFVVCYLCELIKEGKPEKQDHHVRQISWIDLYKAKKLPLLKGTKELIDFIHSTL